MIDKSKEIPSASGKNHSRHTTFGHSPHGIIFSVYPILFAVHFSNTKLRFTPQLVIILV